MVVAYKFRKTDTETGSSCSPLQLNLNLSILGINKMVLLIDSSVVNYIS